MTPEDVPDELAESAEVALAIWCYEKNKKRSAEGEDPRCDCPDFPAIRVIIADTLSGGNYLYE